MSTSSERRLKRLRDLLDQLERLPPSSERERMLREVRARVVDVDTGESPRAMLPVDLDAAPATDAGAGATDASKRASRPRTVTVPKPALPVRQPPREPVADASVDVAADRPPLADVLSLDDAPTVTGPWTRGLRG
jgi:hypothetical protein